MKKWLKNLVIALVLIIYRTNIIANDIDSISLSLQETNRLKVFAGAAYSTFATICNTYKIALNCVKNKIEGDFVECGVAAGAQIATMGYACQQYNADKKIHCFDSFEGIPLAGPNDSHQPGIHGPITHHVDVDNLDKLLVSSGITVHGLQQVQQNMRIWGIDSSYFIYYKGWFQHVLPSIIAQMPPISFLRLDGDLYESTKVCLEYLYPKIVRGGYIVIDDYLLDGCRKAVDEYLNKHNLKPDIISIKDGLGPVYWRVD